MLDESFLEHSFEDTFAEKKNWALISVSKGTTTETYSAFIGMIGFAYGKEE